MNKQNVALNIEGLTKVYKNGVEAVKGVDLKVFEGDFFALLGPNGAGKSTSIGVISSLVNKTQGKVEVFGHNIDTDLEAAKAHLGLVPQEFNFSQFETLGQILVNQAGYYGVTRAEAHKRADKYLTQLGLLEKKDKQARTLSGGMKRRLMIARALMHEPKLLILDEPTSALGQKQQMEVLKTIKKVQNFGNIAIILITHNEIHARLIADRFTFLSLGEVIGSGLSSELGSEEVKRLMAGGAKIGDLAKELEV